MLALEVSSPADRELELNAVPDCLFENLYCIGVGQSLELYAKDAAKPFDKAFVVFVVQELQVVMQLSKAYWTRYFTNSSARTMLSLMS